MKRVIYAKFAALSLVAPLLSFQVQADGLSDLKEALNRLQGTAPITAVLESTIVENRGEGKDKIEKNGFVSINLADTPKGLQITFSPEVLQQVDEESYEKIKNEEANTPTLTAVNRIEANEIRTVLSSSSSLLRRLERATFVDEQAIVHDGVNVRLLNFELPIETIVSDKKTREYVDDFDSNFQVIIAEDGTPLETQLSFKGKGRAYIVLTMKARGNGVTKFKVVDQRLVTVHQEFTTSFESTFGERETKETLQLVL